VTLMIRCVVRSTVCVDVDGYLPQASLYLAFSNIHDASDPANLDSWVLGFCVLHGDTELVRCGFMSIRLRCMMP
jgi:hypothetical protein